MMLLCCLAWASASASQGSTCGAVRKSVRAQCASSVPDAFCLAAEELAAVEKAPKGCASLFLARAAGLLKEAEAEMSDRPGLPAAKIASRRVFTYLPTVLYAVAQALLGECSGVWKVFEENAEAIVLDKELMRWHSSVLVECPAKGSGREASIEYARALSGAPKPMEIVQ